MESQDSSIPSVLTIQDTISVEIKKKKKHWICHYWKWELKDSRWNWTLETLLSKRLSLWSMEGECRWKPGWNAERKFCWIFSSLPSLLPSILTMIIWLAFLIPTIGWDQQRLAELMVGGGQNSTELPLLIPSMFLPPHYLACSWASKAPL